MSEKQKSRKEQIISLRKRYYIIHNLLYFEFLLVIINAGLFTLFLYVMIKYIQSTDVDKIIKIPEWEGILAQVTQEIEFFDTLYDTTMAVILFTFPIIIIVLIRKYQKSIKILPPIYRNYLPDKFLRTDYFPLLIGMSNGYFIFFLFLFIFHDPIILLLIGLTIPIIFFTNYLIRSGKSKEFKRKFLAGTITFVGLMILMYISL